MHIDELKHSPPSDRNEGDAYYTPPEVTRALLDRWDVPPLVGEPCAGDNWITRVLEGPRRQVITADIRDDAPVNYPGVDILTLHPCNSHPFRCVEAIVSNPPYSLAAPIVRKALELCPRVAMFLRLSFLEGCEDKPESKRLDLLGRLSRVIVLPRVSFIQGKSGTDSSTCAWFIWDEPEPGEARRPATIEWVSKADMARYAGQGVLI